VGFISNFRKEFAIIKERDPAIKTKWEVLLYPSFQVMLRYRIAHKLYLKKHYFLARWVSQKAARKTGIEIHPGAQIGEGLFIDHGMGVIIGETAIIGNNVTLFQGVTLGGTGKETGKRHPTLEDNVMVSAGAKILGSFTIGANSKIGAGSVVIKPVPPNSTVVGVPGRVVKQDNVRIPTRDMDQVDLPDPVLRDLERLKQDNEQLKADMKRMMEALPCYLERTAHEDTPENPVKAGAQPDMDPWETEPERRPEEKSTVRNGNCAECGQSENCGKCPEDGMQEQTQSNPKQNSQPKEELS